MAKRFGALFAAAMVVAALVAGCGDSATIATTNLAKPAFLEKADAVCAETSERIEAKYLAFAKPRKGKPIDDSASVERYADTVLIPEKERQVEELRALGAPAGDEAEVEAILDAYEEGIEMAEDNPHAAVTASYGVFVKATELTEDYGLEDCLY